MMRYLLAVVFIVLVTNTPSSATDKAIAPGKASYHGDNGRDTREGSESWADAVVISSLPYSDSGATCDNVDDITLP